MTGHCLHPKFIPEGSKSAWPAYVAFAVAVRIASASLVPARASAVAPAAADIPDTPAKRKLSVETGTFPRARRCKAATPQRAWRFRVQHAHHTISNRSLCSTPTCFF